MKIYAQTRTDYENNNLGSSVIAVSVLSNPCVASGMD